MATALKLFETKNGEFSYDWNDDKRSYLLIKLVREGIPYSDFAKVLNASSFSSQEWANFLNISVRTLERHREENKIFAVFPVYLQLPIYRSAADSSNA